MTTKDRKEKQFGPFLCQIHEPRFSLQPLAFSIQTFPAVLAENVRHGLTTDKTGYTRIKAAGNV